MDALYQSGPSVVHSEGFFFVPVAALTTYVIVATVLTFFVIYQRRATRMDRRRLKEFRDLVARLKTDLHSVHESSTITSLRCLQMEKELDSMRREQARLIRRFANDEVLKEVSNVALPLPSQAQSKTQLQVFRGEDSVTTASRKSVCEIRTSKVSTPSPVTTTIADIAVNDEPDDLTSIWGIGPANQQKLQDNGVFYFEQIAGWSEEEIGRFNSILGFKGRIERERWVEQAQAKLQQQGRSGVA